MKLIVGLGNPGEKYENTRHNLGFMVLDNYAKSLNLDINKEKFNGLYCEFFNDTDKIILLKPMSFMNLSGTVVKKYVDYYKIDPSDMLVISDDLDLDFLDYRLRLFGSSGGHNGLKNIESCLGTNKFKRFRIGISNDKNTNTVNYVLGRFNAESIRKINDFLPISVHILNDYLNLDFEKVMNKYN